MKKIFFILLIFLFSSPAHAQTMAQKLEARYSTLASWQATFVQTTYIEMLSKSIEKNGAIFVMRPDKLKINYTTDPHKTYISNGKRIWVFKEDETTVFQFDKINRVISDEALSFLSGLKNLTELFDVIEDLKEADGFLKIKNTALKKVVIIPKEANSGILRITLGVDTKDTTVREAVLFTASGNVTHYQFNGIEFDKTFAIISCHPER